MKKKLAEITSVLFGWGVYIGLFAGGLAALGYAIALIIGGGPGEAGYALARFIQRTYFPFLVRIVSVSVMLGLVSMYLSGQKALTMVTDKEEANKDIADSKKQGGEAAPEAKP